MARALVQLNPEDGEWLGVRFACDSAAATPQERLKIFIRVEAREQSAEARGSFPGSHRLREFFSLSSATVEEALGPLDGCEVGALRLRCGEDLFLDEKLDRLYYAPACWPTDADEDFSDEIDSLFDSLRSPCAITIHLRPVSLEGRTREALMRQMEELSLWASGFDPERRESGTIEELARSRCGLAKRQLDLCQGLFDQLFTGPCFEFCIWVVSACEREGRLAAAALGRSLAPDGRFAAEPFETEDSDYGRFHQALSAFSPFFPSWELPGGSLSFSRRLARAAQSGWERCPERFERAGALSRLGVLLPLKSAERLIRLPISQGEYKKTIWIESETFNRTAGLERDVVQIGPRQDRPGSACLDVSDLVKHLLVVGASGSGKTVTMINILWQLWEKFAIPFLVLVPIVNPYRALFGRQGSLAEDLRVYTPGQGLSPLQFNPFEALPGTVIGRHISRLMTAFAGGIELTGPLEPLIYQAIVRAYREKGVRPTDMARPETEWPVMSDVVRALRNLMETKGYVGEVRDNLRTAIEVRFIPLCEGLIGQVFNARRSKPGIRELRRYPALIEMEALNLAEQNLLSLFLTGANREALDHDGPSKNPCHCLVVEEAGNLLGAHEVRQAAEGRASPGEHATRMLVKTLTESRDLGQCVMIVNQSPSEIPQAVVQNTQGKLGLRIVEGEDREALASAMALSDSEREDLIRLRPGELFVYHEGLYRAERARSAHSTEGAGRPGDEELLDLIRQREWHREAGKRRLSAYHERLNRTVTGIERLDKALGGLARSKAGRRRLAVRRHDVLKAARSATERVEDTLGLARLDRAQEREWPDLSNRFRMKLKELIESISETLRERSKNNGQTKPNRMERSVRREGRADR